MSAFASLHPAVRYVAFAMVLVVLVALGGFLWIVLGPGPIDFAGGHRVTLADYHAADPTGVPSDLAQASLIERGRYLTRAADCEACHTNRSGKSYAGGLAFVLPFGTLYSTNITPDTETGIGAYSDADFLAAVRRGVGRGGKPLYPAMPYASYAAMTDADALAIKAYLFSIQPVRTPAPENTLAFPFNQRWLMVGWSLLFDRDRRFEPNTERDASWNRGAYLVEAMAHCGECHTPRNLFQALDNRSKFTGAVQAGWRAYNITSDAASGLGAWSDQELSQFLSSGHAHLHGTASGPMGEAVDKSLRYLTPADIASIVAYLRSVPPIANADFPRPKESIATAATAADPLGKRIFEGACASCHGWAGESLVMPFASFAGARAVNDPSAINVAQIVLSGAQRQAPSGIAEMPTFGHAYSDAEIASVANYVTTAFGAVPSAIAAADVAKLRKMQ